MEMATFSFHSVTITDINHLHIIMLSLYKIRYFILVRKIYLPSIRVRNISHVMLNNL